MRQIAFVLLLLLFICSCKDSHSTSKNSKPKQKISAKEKRQQQLKSIVNKLSKSPTLAKEEQKLMQQLSADDRQYLREMLQQGKEERLGAVRALALDSSYDEETIKMLRWLNKDDFIEIRLAAIRAIGNKKLPEDKAISILKHFLYDIEVEVVKEASLFLEKFPPQKTIPVFVDVIPRALEDNAKIIIDNLFKMGEVAYPRVGGALVDYIGKGKKIYILSQLPKDSKELKIFIPFIVVACGDVFAEEEIRKFLHKMGNSVVPDIIKMLSGKDSKSAIKELRRWPTDITSELTQAFEDLQQQQRKNFIRKICQLHRQQLQSFVKDYNNKPLEQKIEKILYLIAKEPDKTIRANTISALGYLTTLSPETVALLIECLKAVDTKISMAAVQSIYSSGKIAEKALPALLEVIIKRRYSQLQLIAIDAIVKIAPEDPQVSAALIKALYQNDRQIEKKARKNLVSIGKSAIPELVKNIDRGNIANILVEIGKPSAVPLVEILSTIPKTFDFSQQEKAKNAIYALGKIGDPIAIPALEKYFYSGNEKLRVAAGFAMTDIGQPAVAILKKILVDPGPLLREEAAYYIAKIGKPAADSIPTLVNIIENDKEHKVRSQAILALGKMGDKAHPHIPLLINLMQDIYLQQTLVPSLVEIGEVCIPAVSKSLSHENASIRFGAAKVLFEFKEKAAPATPQLRKAINDSSSDVREYAYWALSNVPLPIEDKIAIFIRALQDKNADTRLIATSTFEEMQQTAVPAIPNLIKALSDKVNYVSRNAAKALGAIGPAAASAIPHLFTLLKSEDKYTREAVAKSLAKIVPPPEYILQLISVLNDSYWEVRRGIGDTLVAIGKPAVPALIQALQRSSSDVQERIVMTLGKMGKIAAPAIPVLKKLEKHSNTRVSYEIRRALEKIREEVEKKD